MKKDVVIYSSNTCKYCKDAMAYFDSLGIEYTERNVSIDNKFRKELMDKGYRSVPVIMVGEETIRGFDKRKLDKLLK